MFFSLTGRSRIASTFLAVVTAVSLLQGTTARGQAPVVGGFDPEWGAKMIELKAFKFGTVAKGADAAIQVRVKNIYAEPIQITSLSTGCSCVGWDEIFQGVRLPIVVPSGGQRIVTLKLDTLKYDGERTSKARIDLLDPVHGTATFVELPVTAYIRRDVVLVPGSVKFGTVDLGSGSQRKVTVQYAGRQDWKITQAKAINPNLAIEVVETARTGVSPTAIVNYELTFSLSKEAPVGTLREQVILLTDDANNPQVPVMVEASVESDVVITDLSFGTLNVGQAKTTEVIVRAKRPFKIEELFREPNVASKLPDGAFKVKNLDTNTAAPFHRLPVTFIAPAVAGPFEETFSVKISDRAQPLTFKARGRVNDASGAARN